MCLVCDIDGVLKESEGLSIELELRNNKSKNT